MAWIKIRANTVRFRVPKFQRQIKTHKGQNRENRCRRSQRGGGGSEQAGWFKTKQVKHPEISNSDTANR